MFSIGEFSKITGLTVKSLRFYHEQGVLVPAYVDSGSGYRYYSEPQVEVARIIVTLRNLEFSVVDIREILSGYDDDGDILEKLQSQRDTIQARMRKDRQIAGTLDQIITHETEASKTMDQQAFLIEEKKIAPILVASVRMKGKYSDCGGGFAKIGRKFGRFISGKPMTLHHDAEYRENDATFEAAMPVKRGESTDEIVVKELPGGSFVSLMHLGTYDQLGRSYEKLLKHIKEKNIAYSMPTREIYHKGPGMIFKGNPKKYLTEIQIMIDQTGT